MIRVLIVENATPAWLTAGEDPILSPFEVVEL